VEEVFHMCFPFGLLENVVAMVVNTMLVDVKHYSEPYYSKVVGVNVDSLIVYFFDNKEMALDNEFYYQAS
jgi:pyruvate-formate lyase-activating enzyme